MRRSMTGSNSPAAAGSSLPNGPEPSGTGVRGSTRPNREGRPAPGRPSAMPWRRRKTAPCCARARAVRRRSPHSSRTRRPRMGSQIGKDAVSPGEPPEGHDSDDADSHLVCGLVNRSRTQQGTGWLRNKPSMARPPGPTCSVAAGSGSKRTSAGSRHPVPTATPAAVPGLPQGLR